LALYVYAPAVAAAVPTAAIGIAVDWKVSRSGLGSWLRCFRREDVDCAAMLVMEGAVWW
jgi:hypothetical protein